MMPLYKIKSYWIGFLTVISISLAGCRPHVGTCPACANQTFQPNVNLSLVDSATKQELFFGDHPKYVLSDLKIKHVQNGTVDSIPSPVKVDIDKHTLNINLLYTHDIDTVSIQIRTQKAQRLYLATGILNSCCTRVLVTEATFNGKIIFQAPVDPKEQAKMPNLVTVPLK